MSGLNRKAAELREISNEALEQKLRESKEELFNLRFQSVTGQLSNNQRLKQVRREIARIYTVIRERDLGIAPPLTEDVEPSESQSTESATQSADEKNAEKEVAA